MKSIISCLRYLFFTLSSLSIVQTIPPDYCLLPLNRSNCNMAPKTVYSYYKPGSRCEIETWRGCPTANKFDNEYLCSLNCIFRMRQDVVHQLDPIEYNDDKALENINEILKLLIKQEVTSTTEQESTTRSTTETVTESTTEAVSDPKTDAVIESTTEAVIESTTEVVIESTTEAVIESTTEAVIESTTEAVIESTTEVVIESTTEAEDLYDYSSSSDDNSASKSQDIDDGNTQNVQVEG